MGCRFTVVLPSEGPETLLELLRDEARAGTVFIWGLAAVGAASFCAAVLAIAFIK